jgi:iron complex outermembrane receptor protein
MSQFSLRISLFAGAAAAATIWAGAAAAQTADASSASASSGGTLEEIVVTARKRQENLQETPIAISALSAQALEDHRVTTLQKVSELAPNMNVYRTSGSLGSAATYIRGVGFADLILGQDAPIGVYVDGVYHGRNNVQLMQLVEPERIEILRGPQGTLFGRNTTGGAMNITTHTPGEEFGGKVSASYGSHKANSFQGRIDSGQLGDSGVKFTAAYQHRQQDGDIENRQQPSDRSPNAFKSDAYWFKAVGEWGDLSATFSADYNNLTGYPVGLLQIVAASPATVAMFANSASLGGSTFPISQTPIFDFPSLALPSRSPQRVWDQGLSLELNYRLSEYLDLKSITALRRYKRQDSSPNGSADFRARLTTGAVGSFNGWYSVDPRQSTDRQFTQEFQALGSVGDFDYVAGVFILREKGREFGRTRLPAAVTPTGVAFESISVLNYEISSKSVAGFAQVDYRPAFLEKKLQLTGGIRWTKDTKDLDQISTVLRAPSLTNKNWSFLASASYQWTPDFMTYARFASGYRSGGFNVRAGATTNPIYAPEKMKSWEAGFKLEALDRRVRLNGAAFYNKYRDLQVAQFAPPNTTGTGGSSALNANAKYKGFELELQAVPTEGLTLTSAVGYLDAEYTSFPVALDTGNVLTAGCTPISNGPAVVGMDCSGIAAVVNVPKWTVNFGVSYELPAASYGHWSARLDYSYKSSIQWGTLNLIRTPFKDAIAGKGYSVVNGRVSLSDIPLSGSARARLSLYGENLFDKHYVAQGIDFGFAGTNVFNTGREVGIEGSVQF